MYSQTLSMLVWISHRTFSLLISNLGEIQVSLWKLSHPQPRCGGKVAPTILFPSPFWCCTPSLPHTKRFPLDCNRWSPKTNNSQRHETSRRQSPFKPNRTNKSRSSMPSICSCWGHHLGSNSLGYSQLSRSTTLSPTASVLCWSYLLLSCGFLLMSLNPSLSRMLGSYCILDLTITTPHHEIWESTLITQYLASKTFLGHWYRSPGPIILVFCIFTKQGLYGLCRHFLLPIWDVVGFISARALLASVCQVSKPGKNLSKDVFSIWGHFDAFLISGSLISSEFAFLIIGAFREWDFILNTYHL